jgi:CRP/FNR family transcriptional regulator, anaerobic regulatory protein
MASKLQGSPMIPCENCPLQAAPGLRALTPNQLEFMGDFKQGELHVAKGAQMLAQGIVSPHLYSILRGVLIRFKALEDGRRQIVNYLFPGDMVGLQSAMEDPMQHGVEALTEARVCIFQRERFLDLFATHPRLGFDVAWLAARQEVSLDEHLTSVGRRTARERIVYLALFLFLRGRQTGMADKNFFEIPISQAQIADTVGLSVVHTNKSLQALRRSNVIEWTADRIGIHDLDAAIQYAKYELPMESVRPFI